MFSPFWFNLLIGGAFLFCLGLMMYDAWKDSAQDLDEFPPLDLLDSVGSEEQE